MKTTFAMNLRTFLLLLLAATLASANSEFEECNFKYSCQDCLNTGFCDWYAGSFCSHKEARIMDIQMYSMDFTTESVQEICQRADTDSSDSNLCSSLTDCTSCVQGVLSDGSNCGWFADAGFCNAGCGMLGCGETTCSEGPPSPVIGGEIAANSPGEGTSPLTGVDTDEIMCKSQNDPASCAGMVPMDPNSRCVWVANIGSCGLSTLSIEITETTEVTTEISETTETTEVITGEFSAAGSFGYYKSSILLVVFGVISVVL